MKPAVTRDDRVASNEVDKLTNLNTLSRHAGHSGRRFRSHIQLKHAPSSHVLPLSQVLPAPLLPRYTTLRTQSRREKPLTKRPATERVAMRHRSARMLTGAPSSTAFSTTPLDMTALSEGVVHECRMVPYSQRRLWSLKHMYKKSKVSIMDCSEHTS